MRTSNTTGNCPVEDSNEAVDFLLRLAEALGRSLAQEDNEQDMAPNEGTSHKRDDLQ
jgi:pyrroloquinoline quinone (PQQ) biosynthesis protein C